MDLVKIADALVRSAREVLRGMPYKEYLLTEHWQEVRQRALERSGNRCDMGCASKKLHVHHRTYERRGFERDEDVRVLCEECHGKFHDIAEPENQQIDEHASTRSKSL